MSYPVRGLSSFEKEMDDKAQSREIRAPRDDGGRLIEPPVDTVASLASENRRRLAECDYDVHGRSLHELARDARRQLLEAAVGYADSYCDLSHSLRMAIAAAMANDEPARIYLAGHQPELYHPGVWLKNFVVDRLAARDGAIAVNLSVDSDVVKSASIRVPTGTADEPRVEAVPLDQPSTAIPFEDRRITDLAVFRSFGKRGADTIAPLVSHPFVEQFWPVASERGEATGMLGEALAQARHRAEIDWGVGHTLQLPQSAVCSLPAFFHFAAHLLTHLPRFADIYNASLAEYRRANRIRSTAHPVPALVQEGDWLEAPFWVWRRDEPVRRRLFVRYANDGLLLSDRACWEFPLHASAESSLERAIEELTQLNRLGVRLRTRALLTTMMARVFSGDWFAHGIGGAKYDQMNDRIIERFFGLQPPSYQVVSGTLLLPIKRGLGSSGRLQQARRQLRDLQWNPDRYLETTAETISGRRCECERNGIERSIREKQRWISTSPTPANARERFLAIRAANEALQRCVQVVRERAEAEARAAAKHARAEQILSSREYSFCLYREEQLREFLLDI
jgi:hypothetical protein